MLKFKKFRELKKEEKHQYFVLIFYASLTLNLMFFGGCLNQIAMSVNNNRMPVLLYEGSYSQDVFHSFYSDKSEVRLFFLTDVFKVGKYICSVGDVILTIAFLLFVFVDVKIIILDFKIRRIKHGNKVLRR